MSVLVALVTPYATSHVADMQLTSLRDGKPAPELQRKSIAYSGDNVRCLVGWVGLATATDDTFGSHNTGNWLHHQLDCIVQSDPPLDVLLEDLTNCATISYDPLVASDKRCEFVLTGWFRVGENKYGSFLATISNYEISPWEISPRHSQRFQYSVIVHRRKSKHPYVLKIMGDEATARELPLYWKGLRGLLKRRSSISRLSGASRQSVAAIAMRQKGKQLKDASYVRTVGGEQLTVEMMLDGSVNTYSSKNGTVHDSLPADFVSAFITSKDVVVARRVDGDGTIHLNMKGWLKTKEPVNVQIA